MISLVPRPQLLAALVIGAAFVALTSVHPAWWVAAGLYHLGLAALLVRDALRLPPRRSFQADRQLPAPFSLGVVSSIRLTLQNPRAAGLLAEVADHAPEQLGPSPRVLSGAFDPGGRLQVDYSARAPSRGAFRFGSVDLRCWRPRGWWTRQVRIPLEQDCAVYPDAVAVRRYQLTLRRRMPLRPGLRRARPPGATTAFAGLRDYLPGDDIRRVNWKATARKDQPVINEVEAERGQQVLIALDCGRLMTAPAGDLTKLDHAVNAALLLGWVAQQQGDRVGLVCFTDAVDQFLQPGRGAGQMHKLNEVLYAVRPQYVEPDFGEAFAHASNRINRRSLVVVLTDILDAGASRDLVRHAVWLARRHLVVVVAMSDPSLLAARDAPIDRAGRAYEWAAAEELLSARRQSFELLRRGGVLGLDVPAGSLSPLLVERYLELKERALV